MRRCSRCLSTTRGEAGSILFLSPSLWPEPSSSAAGVRTSSLLQHFASKPSLFTLVSYGSGATKPSALTDYAHLHSLSTEYGIKLHDIPPNRSGTIKQILSNDFQELDAVVFDRYFAEEAYSFHFQKLKPKALRILDMQDFHALRLARQELLEHSTSTNNDGWWMDDDLMDRLMACIPMHGHGSTSSSHTKKGKKKSKNTSDALLRELASIHRSDLTLVCSRDEYGILTKVFQVDPSKLCLAPFFSEENDISYDSPAHQFDQRSDFCVLGGLRHPPNVDSVKWLKSEIWSKILAHLPDAKVHIWGAYPPQHIMQLNDPKRGFFVHGKLGSLNQELSSRRVLLAPLRFGAGIKGKIVDAWEYGCPVVTTPIGAEGTTMSRECFESCTVRSGQDIIDDTGWGGLVATDADAIARCAIRLYKDQGLWDEARSNSRRLLRVIFDKEKNLSVVTHAIKEALLNIDERRHRDNIGAMLWHQSMRSTEYFSRWIEFKEENK